MLNEFQNFADRIANGEDYEVISHSINERIHLVFTSDNFEIDFSRHHSGDENVYIFQYNGSNPHRISYYRDYEEFEIAESLAEAFLISENF